ncbi:hypothetical protein [Noviherbaspirillum pedocola]|uniref:Uncharacterized protein n=1 Tax=Noviherbaspirillum pedocola TaxID=2801341 RepID=A0A934W8I4_9BURK|nr:hypothetical protein [Noviherbaspirillum pedocola]MBK4738672.1 hypothetical protein [Noviherbaspirillum pedocola]
MQKIPLVFLLSALPVLAVAADKWIPVISQNAPGGPILLNTSTIQVNGNGNRVATLRILAAKGYQTDMLIEFDCRSRRTHTLASATTDTEGHLIAAGGRNVYLVHGRTKRGIWPSLPLTLHFAQKKKLRDANACSEREISVVERQKIG